MELIAALVDVNRHHGLTDEPNPKYFTRLGTKYIYLAVGITWSVLNSHYTKHILVNLFTHIDD